MSYFYNQGGVIKINIQLPIGCNKGEVWIGGGSIRGEN